jgi:hypothetical protein
MGQSNIGCGQQWRPDVIRRVFVNGLQSKHVQTKDNRRHLTSPIRVAAQHGELHLPVSILVFARLLI